ncbi:hypothetical protein [Chitinophaga rhizophila]|uniref:Uncharacterized protein n=1 Tax=Chitinophaga rhizophila TaxID=2866212 RepID=A0ABS7G647_9BACT|nr:hypothetical protein [Chitinophaga rhizophila]MBW8682926.1 hypothetical protein [Chitinophaga rhizophila]
MAFQITYRRLAVVNMLHSFYLDKEDSSYYSLSQEDQEFRLADLLMDNRYNLMDDVEIIPTPATDKIIKGHRIVYRQTSTGIVIGVASSPGADGALTTAVPLDAALRLQFLIRLKNNALLSRSNLRINPVFPACYYFTNDDTTTGKSFPSLSAAIQPIQEGRVYEMGETAMMNGNASQAIARTDSAAAGWIATDNYHYINEEDRILLPLKFTYTFDQQGVTTAGFTLLKGADEISVLPFQQAGGLREALLDFTGTPDGIYTLKIAGSNNYNRTYTVYLHSTLYQREAWGVLDLVMHTAEPAYQLIDAEGLLTVPAAPVFELRFASRSTYWKYYLQKGDTPGADSNWNEVSPAPPGIRKVIISKQPYPLMQSYRKVSYAAVNLPNPDGELLSRQGDLICSEILLTKMKL